MERRNMSSITTIHFLGFQIPHGIRFFIYFLFLIIYCVTICGNLLIITLVSYSKSLHSPMYIFLTQLSVSDIILITDILPNVLHSVLVKETSLSFSDCHTQFYFLTVSGTSECLLLTSMSYDRYLAICKPLHYATAMTIHSCCIMVTICWITSLLIALIHTSFISQLKFCGPGIVDHFFCDFDPIIQLSCYDTTNVLLQLTLLSAVIVVLPFCIIIISYVYIIMTIFKIPSITGRQKVFSTCSSHLTVVSIYYGTLMCVYLFPSRVQSLSSTKFLSLIYTVVTPMLNPMIYSLRNKDLKQVMAKIINHGWNLLSNLCR